MTAPLSTRPADGRPGPPGTDRRITNALQTTLVDSLRLSLLAKHAHWNVAGPRFHGLHRQLDELAAVARQAADLIAERIVALGAAPDGRPDVVLEVPSALDAGPLLDTELIADLLRVLMSVTEQTASAISADLADDPVSQSIVIDLAGELDKQAWLLAAQR